jgi:hypothetical protein
VRTNKIGTHDDGIRFKLIWLALQTFWAKSLGVDESSIGALDVFDVDLQTKIRILSKDNIQHKYAPSHPPPRPLHAVDPELIAVILCGDVLAFVFLPISTRWLFVRLIGVEGYKQRLVEAHTVGSMRPPLLFAECKSNEDWTK